MRKKVQCHLREEQRDKTFPSVPCCRKADVKADNQRRGGGTSKIEPDLLGQEKQEKGHEGDNENAIQKLTV